MGFKLWLCLGATLSLTSTASKIDPGRCAAALPIVANWLATSRHAAPESLFDYLTKRAKPSLSRPERRILTQVAASAAQALFAPPRIRSVLGHSERWLAERMSDLWAEDLHPNPDPNGILAQSMASRLRSSKLDQIDEAAVLSWLERFGKRHSEPELNPDHNGLLARGILDTFEEAKLYLVQRASYPLWDQEALETRLQAELTVQTAAELARRKPATVPPNENDPATVAQAALDRKQARAQKEEEILGQLLDLLPSVSECVFPSFEKWFAEQSESDRTYLLTQIKAVRESGSLFHPGVKHLSARHRGGDRLYEIKPRNHTAMRVIFVFINQKPVILRFGHKDDQEHLIQLSKTTQFNSY